MKLVSCLCPQCNAPLEVDSDARSFTCQFCGATALLDSGGHTKLVKAVKREVMRELRAELREASREPEPEPESLAAASDDRSLLITAIAFLASLVLVGFIIAGFVLLMRDKPSAPHPRAVVVPTIVVPPPVVPPPAVIATRLRIQAGPLAVDLNGDGDEDLVVVQGGHWQAYDGLTGAPVWSGAEVDGEIGGDFLSVVNGVLLRARDDGEVTGVSLATGRETFTSRLPERVSALCGTPAGAVLTLLDHRRLLLELPMGATVPAGKPGPCTPPTTSNREREVINFSDYERFGVPRYVGTPLGTMATLMGGAFVPREGKARYLFGKRERGTEVPMVARYEAGKLKWASLMASSEPLTSSHDSPRATVVGHALITDYTHGTRGPLLAALDTETGARLWEVPMPRCSGIPVLAATRSLVVVSCWGSLTAISAHDGATVFTLGP